MIPKIIHYCWFGRSPLPTLAIKCIESWKKYFPDYEIREWNEDNFDIDIIPYTSQAYQASKYAFVSDYARFWILYQYGGIYFDTDVEVIKTMDDIIVRGPFMGCEMECSKSVNLMVNPGLGFGVNPGHDLIKEMLDKYSKLSFFLPNGMYNQVTVVNYTSDLLFKYGLKNENIIQEVAGIYIYPKEYFCPKDYVTNKLVITERTCSIHHYSASWKSQWERKILRIWVPLSFRYPWLTDSIKSVRSGFFSTRQYFTKSVRFLRFWG